MQLRLKAAANIPMVSMNSSTGMPLRTWTFLKTVSDICGLGSCGARPLANMTPANINEPMTTRINRHDVNFIWSPFVCGSIQYASFLLGGGNERSSSIQRHALHAVCASAGESQRIQNHLGQLS